MEFKQDKLERQSARFTVKAKALPHGEFEAVLSTDDLDRHGERVSIKGLNIPKNQKIKMYYNHETSGANLPIGIWEKVWKSAEGKLMGRGVIDLEDEFAVKVYKKVLKGFIDSISIGFYPQEFDGESSTWTKSELVEASVVAEPANVNAVITSKQLGFTEEEFTKSLKVKLKEVKAEVDDPEQVTVKRLIKGAVEDVLLEPKKWELMKDFYDVMYAFEEAYYDQETPATDFNKLLQETILLLQKIIDGTFESKGKQSTTDGAVASELKSIVTELKSRVGAVEDALQASAESPATKTLIRLRVAAKKVDHAAEELNRTIKVKLKET